MKRVWLLVLVCLLLPALAQAELRYQGEQTLWKDTVWSGEVTIDGILTVAPQVRLEIRPGTTVRFTYFDSNNDGIGEHELFVQGVLDARGTSAAPIRFTAAGPQRFPGAWGAINMMASEAGNHLDHCIVEYAYRGFHAHFGQGEIVDCLFRHNLRAFQFQDSTVAISRCRIEDNFNGLQFRDATVNLADSLITGGQWGIRGVYSTLNLSGCRIENNRINGVNLRESELHARGNRIAGNRRGVYLQGSRGELVGNRIVNNAEHGTFFENCDCRVTGNRIAGNGRAGVRWLNSTGPLTGNDLSGNGEFALINDGRQPLDATGNWWGSADSGPIADLVRDAAERPACGPVTLAAPLVVPPEIESGPEPQLPALAGEGD